MVWLAVSRGRPSEGTDRGPPTGAAGLADRLLSGGDRRGAEVLISVFRTLRVLVHAWPGRLLCRLDQV